MTTKNASPLAFRIAKEVPIRSDMLGSYDEGTQLWVPKENGVRADGGEVVSSEWISNTMGPTYVTEVNGHSQTDIDYDVDYDQDMDSGGGGWGSSSDF